jgi:hemerythrin-like domain-containing protein
VKPTEILSREHRVIEQVLHCLEEMVRRAKSAGRLDGTAAHEAVAFLRNFADHCHHGKEEDHLFPALEAAGFARQGGPTGVMLHEHELGRAHLRGIDENIEAAAAGDAAALGRFVSHAEAYLAVLREHIYKEDHVLFPLAERTLGEEEQQRLLEEFRRVEAEEMGVGTHERYLHVAQELAKQYGVAAAPTTAPAGPFHCGCGE